MKDAFVVRALKQEPPSLDDALVLIDHKAMLGPDVSSPHIVSISWVEQNLLWSRKRKELFKDLFELIKDLKDVGINSSYLMIGGSFLSYKDNPGDIDGLLIYSVSGSINFSDVKAIIDRKKSNIDIRIVPEDAGTAALIKMVCFCHTLYQGEGAYQLKSSILMVI